MAMASDFADESQQRARRLQLCIDGAEVDPRHGAITPCLCPGAARGFHLVECPLARWLFAPVANETDPHEEAIEACDCPRRGDGLHSRTCPVMQEMLGEDAQASE